MDLSDLSLGICSLCGKEQSKIGQDGYWICREGNVKWVCLRCKEKYSIRSYPVGCEWCKYTHVQWYQGHTYDCPRCKYLGIQH